MTGSFYSPKRTFKKRVDVEYVEVHIHELKRGDRFIVIEPDGTQYPEQIATKGAVQYDGLWGVEANEWKGPL